MTTIRTRELPLRKSSSVTSYRNSYFPSWNYDSRSQYSLSGTQYTESEGHPFPIKGSDEDLGGEFLTRKSSYSDNCRPVTVEDDYGEVRYSFRGTLFPYMPAEGLGGGDAFPHVDASDDSELDAAGTTAISRVLPTNPVAGLATALGELREGFPKVIGTDLFKIGGKPPSKRLGDEYLNYQFGWAPMVSDFKKWLTALQDSDKIWKQFQRDAGRRVRRRYYFPETTEVTESTLANHQIHGGPSVGNLWQDGFGSAYGTLYIKTEVKRRRWFSGAFIYYLDVNSPSMSAFSRDLQRQQKLYGVKITPEVIWNLTPWSWAADWFGNMGDVLHNVSQFSQDGLVMPYGYMMETTVVTTSYSMRNVGLKGLVIPDLTQNFTTTVKRRRKATPFGFGLDFDSFSQFQLSIIAALGLSKRR